MFWVKLTITSYRYSLDLCLLSGYLLEIIFLNNDDDNNLSFETTFYLTHMDIAIGNTFITTSGFIILLLTIDRLIVGNNQS